MADDHSINGLGNAPKIDRKNSCRHSLACGYTLNVQRSVNEELHIIDQAKSAIKLFNLVYANYGTALVQIVDLITLVYGVLRGPVCVFMELGSPENENYRHKISIGKLDCFVCFGCTPDELEGRLSQSQPWTFEPLDGGTPHQVHTCVVPTDNDHQTITVKVVSLFGTGPWDEALIPLKLLLTTDVATILATGLQSSRELEMGFPEGGHESRESMGVTSFDSMFKAADDLVTTLGRSRLFLDLEPSTRIRCSSVFIWWAYPAERTVEVKYKLSYRPTKILLPYNTRVMLSRSQLATIRRVLEGRNDQARLEKLAEVIAQPTTHNHYVRVDGALSSGFLTTFTFGGGSALKEPRGVYDKPNERHRSLDSLWDASTLRYGTILEINVPIHVGGSPLFCLKFALHPNQVDEAINIYSMLVPVLAAELRSIAVDTVLNRLNNSKISSKIERRQFVGSLLRTLPIVQLSDNGPGRRPGVKFDRSDYEVAKLMREIRAYLDETPSNPDVSRIVNTLSELAFNVGVSDGKADEYIRELNGLGSPPYDLRGRNIDSCTLFELAVMSVLAGIIHSRRRHVLKDVSAKELFTAFTGVSKFTWQDYRDEFERVGLFLPMWQHVAVAKTDTKARFMCKDEFLEHFGAVCDVLGEATKYGPEFGKRRALFFGQALSGTERGNRK